VPIAVTTLKPGSKSSAISAKFMRERIAINP
jgi:hypothetical protein